MEYILFFSFVITLIFVFAFVIEYIYKEHKESYYAYLVFFSFISIINRSNYIEAIHWQFEFQKTFEFSLEFQIVLATCVYIGTIGHFLVRMGLRINKEIDKIMKI